MDPIENPFVGPSKAQGRFFGGAARPWQLLVAGVVLVAILDVGLFVSLPPQASQFPLGQYPVRQLLLGQGTNLSFNGTGVVLLQFSIAAAGGILVGQIYVDHTESVYLWPFEMYPSHIFPQCSAGGGFWGAEGVMTLDVPLSPGIGYGFGSQCPLWGNATIIEPIEIVYP